MILKILTISFKLKANEWSGHRIRDNSIQNILTIKAWWCIGRVYDIRCKSKKLSHVFGKCWHLLQLEMKRSLFNKYVKCKTNVTK